MPAAHTLNGGHRSTLLAEAHLLGRQRPRRPGARTCPEPAAEGRLRVVSVAHTAVSREAGRLRYHPLAAQTGLDVHLFVPARWYQFGRWHTADPGADPGVTLHPLPIRIPRAGRAKWYLHWYPRLPALVRALSPQVLHLWEEPWDAVALQAAMLARRHPGTALVLEVDQNILKRLPQPFEWVRRFVLRNTALVLSRSQEATAVVQACGYHGPVQPIGYGVDRTVFRPNPAASVRDRGLGLTIGYVGRIVEEKGLDDALDAIARTRHPVKLAIMGEGPHQGALQARIAALGLAERVTFRGWGPATQVAAFLASLDALILLTRTTTDVREQFGRVILEAQGCGVPVIGSACGAIPEVIGAGGWVIDERNFVQLSQLLDELSEDRAELTARGAAGLHNVLNRFTYEGVSGALTKAWCSAAACRWPSTGGVEAHLEVQN